VYYDRCRTCTGGRAAASNPDATAKTRHLSSSCSCEAEPLRSRLRGGQTGMVRSIHGSRESEAYDAWTGRYDTHR
jgi:hypothetical protein